MNSDVENSFEDLNSELLEILPPDYPDGGGDEVGADEEDGELPGPDGLLHQEGGDPSHGKEEEQSNEPCGHTEHTVSNEWRFRRRGVYNIGWNGLWDFISTFCLKI